MKHSILAMTLVLGFALMPGFGFAMLSGPTEHFDSAKAVDSEQNTGGVAETARKGSGTDAIHQRSIKNQTSSPKARTRSRDSGTVCVQPCD
jgi:hypothetical protein